MRLIDADALNGKLSGSIDEVLWEIYHAPTVDAVSVVSCKDCKWQSTVHDADDNSNYYMCGVWSQPTDQDAFCSWGERRSE